MSSQIDINIRAVRSDNKPIGKQVSKILDIRSGVSSVKSNLDGRVLNRKNIAGNLSTAMTQIDAIGQRVKKVHNFIDASMDIYEEAEYKVKVLTEDFRDKYLPKSIGEKIFDAIKTIIMLPHDMKGFFEDVRNWNLDKLKQAATWLKDKGEIVLKAMDPRDFIQDIVDKAKEKISNIPNYKPIQFLKDQLDKIDERIIEKAKVWYDNALTKVEKVVDFTGKHLKEMTDKAVEGFNKYVGDPLKEFAKDAAEWGRDAKKAISDARDSVVRAIDKATKPIVDFVDKSIDFLKSITPTKIQDFITKAFKALPFIDAGFQAVENFKEIFFDGGSFKFTWERAGEFLKKTGIDIATDKLVELVAIGGAAALLGPLGLASAGTVALVFLIGTAALNVPYLGKKKDKKSVTEVAQEGANDAFDWVVEKLFGSNKNNTTAENRVLASAACAV